MILTRRRALEITKELWEWMRDTKAKSAGAKFEWPGWSTYGRMESNCPCCEYDEQNNGKMCENCPLYTAFHGNCLEEDSLYRPFAIGKGTPEAAQQIIDACVKELDLPE